MVNNIKEIEYNLNWSDLTSEEKEQARGSYLFIRSEEEQRAEELIDSDGALSCSFDREEDGYIMVWV